MASNTRNESALIMSLLILIVVLAVWAFGFVSNIEAVVLELALVTFLMGAILDEQ